MGLAATATVLTTEGVRTLKELIDQPFIAVINDDLFPCKRGAFSEGRRDLYELKTNWGYRTLATYDQPFYTMSGEFLTGFDIENREEEERPQLRLAISDNYRFEKGKDYKAGLESKGFHPDFEFESSGFYQGFFHRLWKECGKFAGFYASFVTGPLHYPDFQLVQRMLLRSGVMCNGYFPNGASMLFGVGIKPFSLDNYVKAIGFENQEDYVTAVNIIERAVPSYPRAKFVHFNYHSTDETFTCEIEGIGAFDADGFYVGDSTSI